MSPELSALLKSASEQKTFRELNLMKVPVCLSVPSCLSLSQSVVYFLFQTSEKVEKVLLALESCDQDQLMGDEPQVVASVVGPPPREPPAPPSGVGVAQADEVTEDWGGNNSVISDEQVSDEEHSQDSSHDSSDASQDAISVLAQAAVEEVMEEAVRQAQHPSSASIDANAASMEASSPRPCSALSEEDSPQPEEDSPPSQDWEEEGRWMAGEASFPPPPRPASSSSANQLQASIPSGDNDDAEVTREAETHLPCPVLSLPRWPPPPPRLPPQVAPQADPTFLQFLQLC